MKFITKELIKKNLSKSRVRTLKPRIFITLMGVLTTSFLLLTSCQTPSGYRHKADKVALDIIQKKQIQALEKLEEFSIEKPRDTLRRRLLIEQHLLYSGEASLGSDKLKQIEHWPEKGYPKKKISMDSKQPLEENKPLTFSLLETLQIGARNSFEYQTKKEEIFRAALDFDLERDKFRSTFKGQQENLFKTDLSGSERVTGTENSGSLSLSKTLKSGAALRGALTLDVVKLLTQEGSSSLGIVADATIAIPLLRGSGKHIVTEPLTQAERDVIYTIYEFERFKKTFSVNIAGSYLEVLKQLNGVENTEENYRNLMLSTRRTSRMADAGRTTEIEVGQALQNELRARNRWITAQESYENRLDVFKSLIGLPPDADIVLDRAELERLLSASTKSREEIAGERELPADEKASSVEESIELIKPSQKNAGPLEMNPSLAIKLGLENRLDLRVAHGKVYDTQRKVVVLADALRAELTLFGSAELGEARSIATGNLDSAKLQTNKGIYSALLTIDLPFERTAERNAYRKGFIALEQAVGDVQKLEDEIKLSIRNRLRSMYESRESLRIQTRAVVVAEERVKSTALFFEAGRAQLRDVLDAEEALVTARNGLTSAAVAYRVAELEFQRDTGLLQVDEKGLWQEYSPEGSKNVRKK